MSNKDTESIKVGVALRVCRAALGITQTELAASIGVAKVTLARVETLESNLKSDSFLRAVKLFREHGLEIDTMTSDGINLKISAAALDNALQKLMDSSNRRADRKVTVSKK
jgi:DNA-binding XRE family transcriptional regulator